MKNRLSKPKFKRIHQTWHFLAILLVFSTIFLSCEGYSAYKTAKISLKKIYNVSSIKSAYDRPPDKTVRSVITAYSNTPDQTDDTPDITANGKHVYDGLIAANWLPFGTKIKIPELYGNKIFTVDDRMNARFGYGRLDVYLHNFSRDEARKFGVKYTPIEIFYPEQKLAAR